MVDSKAHIAKRVVDADTYYYIFSLTDKKDDLAMWSLYGKNGVRLKFSQQKIKKFFSDLDEQSSMDGFSVSMAPVKYQPDLDRYKHTTSFLCKDSCYQFNAWSLLYFMFAFEKSFAFQYESEIRVGVCCPLRLFGEKRKKVFLVKDDLIKPQLELPDFPVQDKT